jgi:putative tryptophan/tyrosine transport system substrate-binding protein
MKRREFIGGLGSAAGWPLVARAQQPAMPVIGWLYHGTRDESFLSAFRRGLGELGFVEGKNVAIEYRWTNNQPDRLPALAADLVRRRVSVIAAAPNPIGIAPAKTATAVIPIVFLSGPDPVTPGLVASLNRPGGNLTGVTLLTSDTTTKRLGLLHALVPKVASIAMLLQKTSTQSQELKEGQSAGHEVGLHIVDVWANNESELEAAFATAVREGAGALLVASRILFIDHRHQLVQLAAKHNMPAMYTTREYVEVGGLMSYSPSLTDAFRQVGAYTGRILKGEKPGDLPVVQPTKFEFVINLKTAKALGLNLPPTLLALADEVIE